MGEYYRSHHEDEFEYESDGPSAHHHHWVPGGDLADPGEEPQTRSQEDHPDEKAPAPGDEGPLGPEDDLRGESLEGDGREDPFGHRPDKPIAEYTPREIGCEGERLAAAYLRRRNYRVICRNWRSDVGEVDVVCEDGSGEVVLVEVKTRLDLGAAGDVMPELAVDRRKQRRYRKLALCYLLTHPEVEVVRFDVIAISIVGERCARLRHLIGAFSWDER